MFVRLSSVRMRFTIPASGHMVWTCHGTVCYLLNDNICQNIADESSGSHSSAAIEVNSLEIQYGHRLCPYETISG
jgi:hypothetical protein